MRSVVINVKEKIMTDLSNSVIIPREDFLEMQEVAFANNHVPTIGERVGSSAQGLVFFAGIAAAVTAGTWGWAKAVDWREERALKRAERAKQNGIDAHRRP